MEALPQWTSKVDKRGLDPLGLQNAGVILYQALLPGISNITLRMRYYGFFCWLSDAYARRGVTTDFEIWRQWVRRAEALFALVCADATGQGGVGGIEWAVQALESDEGAIDFATAASTDRNAKQYLIQRLGVFGAAYFTQMQEVGLFEVGPDSIQRVTADAGLAAANAFRASIGPQVEAKFIEAVDAGRVDRSILTALHPMVPSAIPESSDEQAMYETTLFAAGPQQLTSDKSRCASLSLILHVASCGDEKPTPETVRWALFDSPAVDLPSDLETQRLLWEAYQCQDLFQVAAASLLAWAISIMGEGDEGRTLAEIQGAAEGWLAEADRERASATWDALREAVDIDAFPWRETWLRLTGKRGSPEEKAWDAVLLIAALHRRVDVRDRLNKSMRAALPINGHGRSIVTELRWFDHHQNLPVSQLVGDYVVRRIVLRHSWVAMQKLRRQRDYTFLFEARDGRLMRLSGYQPVATTPRLAPAIQFLEDVHLVSSSGITTRGDVILGANR